MLTFLLVLLVGSSDLYGTVRAERTEEPVTQALVEVTELDRRTVTDSQGYFVLPGLPSGSWTVRVHALGYTTWEGRIDVTGENFRLNVALEVSPLRVEGVVVGPSALDETAATGAGATPVRISGDHIRRVPALAEADVLRSVQTLPAVAAISDFSSAPYVRGGAPEQTAVTLDGVPLFNPYHLGGLFGAVDPDLVADVIVSPGGLSAGQEDRLSGIVAIQTRRGGRDRHRGRGAVGLTSSRASLNGPLPGSGNGTYVVSLRRSYLDLLTDAAYALNLTSVTLPYAFTDGYGKVTWEIGERGVFSASGYLNAERFRIPDRMREETGVGLDFGWGSRMGTVSYRHQFTPAVVGSFRVASTGFYGDFDGSEERRYPTDADAQEDPFVTLLDSRSRAHGLLSEASLTWELPRHRIRAGIRADAYAFQHRLDYPDGSGGAPILPAFERVDRPVTVALYLEDDWTLTRNLSLRGGLRFLDAGRLGSVLMPRGGIRWEVLPGVALTAGGGRYAQVIQSLRNEEALGASLLAYDVPAGVDATSALPMSEDVVFGAEWGGGRTTLRADAYLKRFHNLRIPPVPDDPLDAPMLVPDGHRDAEGQARGIEFVGRHLLGRTDLSLAYAWSETEYATADERFAPRHNRRHVVDAQATLPAGGWGRWTARLQYASGQPFTPVTGVARFDRYDATTGGFVSGGETLLLGDHNSERLPSYLRLDVGARWDLQRRWFGTEVQLVPYLQVLNALNTRNVLIAYPGTEGVGPPVLNYVPQLPLVPTFGIEWQW